MSNQKPQTRQTHLDALRGTLMILMAIDHASYFIAQRHVGEFWGIPLPRHPDALSFLTRFVTHFSAPGFFLLMGAGLAFFVFSRRNAGWTDVAIKKKLAWRGLLLIGIQLTVENIAWLIGVGGVPYEVPGGGDSVLLHFGVLYGLGASMIAAALLIHLNSNALLFIGAICAQAAQFLTPDAGQANTLFSPLTRLLLVPGQTNIVQVFYPLVPWLGLALFGLVFGRWILADSVRASRRALALGGSFLALFLLVRVGNGFGNIHPIEGPTWMDALNVTKYPPSLAYIFLTLGVNLLLLALFFRVAPFMRQRANFVLVFGQTPLLFYIAHLYLYAVMGWIVTRFWEIPLAAMYLFWALGLALLYPLCKRYKTFKDGKPLESAWRMF